MNKFPPILDTVIRKVVSYQATGQHRPEWLQKQVDSIYSASLPALTDALMDERDALDQAVYIPYKIGEMR